MADVGDKEPTLPLFLVLLCRIMQDSYQTRNEARLPPYQGKANPQAQVLTIFILRVNRQLRNIGNQVTQIILVWNRKQIQNTHILDLISLNSQLLGCHIVDSDNLPPAVGRKHAICHIGQDTGKAFCFLLKVFMCQSNDLWKVIDTVGHICDFWTPLHVQHFRIVTCNQIFNLLIKLYKLLVIPAIFQ